MARKVYLGDGVYADLNGGELFLTTENGIATTNTIILEPQVLDALLDYLARVELSPRLRARLRQETRHER